MVCITARFTKQKAPLGRGAMPIAETGGSRENLGRLSLVRQ